MTEETNPHPRPVLAWKNPREIPREIQNAPPDPQIEAPAPAPEVCPRWFRLFLYAFAGAFLFCALCALLDH